LSRYRTTDVPFSNRPGRRVFERRKHVLGPHMKAVDVVEPAVIGLRHDRQAPRLQPGPAYLPLQDRITHHANAVRIRDRDRIFHKAAFLDPRRAGHLAIAVEREPRAEYRVRARFAAGQDHRHARAHGPLSDHALSVSSDDRGMAHLYPRHIRDRVVTPGRAANPGIHVLGARARLSVQRRWQQTGRRVPDYLPDRRSRIGRFGGVGGASKGHLQLI
jgi:hypothetical protein